jgi:MoxR-like ATPase
MARPKQRTIGERFVIWHSGDRAGQREPIRAAKVTSKRNGYAADCWACGARVEKAAGVVAFFTVASQSKDLSGAVHLSDECTDRAVEWMEAIRTTPPPPQAARDADPTPPPPADPPPADPPPPAEPPADTPPPPAADPAPVADGDPRNVLRDWLGVGEQAPVDRAQVEELIAEALEKLEALRPHVELRVGDKPAITLPDGRHAMADEALAVVTCPERMLWLVGPTGTGKTYLARQLADLLGLRYFEQACYGASESALVGYATATGEYVCSPTVAAVDATREPDCPGVLLCLDEIDGCDEAAALAWNSLLGGDGVATPRRPGQGHTHRGDAPLYIVATSNTDASAYGSREYNARSKLDDATRDRLLRFRVFVDYDRNVERAYVDATSLPAEVADKLWAIREKIREVKLEGRHISTRSFKYLGEMYATHPDRWTHAELLEKELATWTDEERAKVDAPRGTGGA